MYNKWVADKTASESDVVLARYYNSLFEIIEKQQKEIEQEKEKNKKLEALIGLLSDNDFNKVKEKENDK